MMRFKILKENAEKIKVNLNFCPVFMQRHLNNISFYYTKEKKLFWVFELIYVKREVQENEKTQTLKKLLIKNLPK